ncbi:MAG: winged helix-turn-helix transcriptional regulator [Thermoplasmata archaeon]|nr:MAG: winged helix-turn-helix transcriptional regulator [Thermoplasmata archaeon]
MELLREKSLSTKVLILLEIATGHYSQLSPIAEKIGITKQGVSDYLKKMREEGLIHIMNGEYRASVKGIEFLHSQLMELKEFLDKKIQKLNIIENCAAIAGNEIRKGEKVGLFMKNGELVAYQGKKSSSMGVAMRNARKGEDVPIKNMEGIVEHEMGKIYLIELPSPSEGGTKACDIKKIKEIVETLKIDRIGACDVVAKVLLRKLKKPYDFEFACAYTTIEAAQKGLNVLLLGWSEGIKKAISAIEDFNLSSPRKIRYELFAP